MLKHGKFSEMFCEMFHEMAKDVKMCDNMLLQKYER